MNRTNLPSRSRRRELNEHRHIPSARDYPEGRQELWRDHLVNELSRHDGAVRRQRRRLVLALAVGVSVLVAASGFTTYAMTREVTQVDSVGCFDAADLRANVTIVSADGRDARAICAEVWRADGASPAPSLEACILESGVVGVFPATGAGTCARVGIADVPPGHAVEAKRFADLRAAIAVHLGEPPSGSSRGSSKCLGERAARRAVRRELDAHGYARWEIEVAPGVAFTDERPCAEVSLDAGREVVMLIPVWE
jgi:hypothetical protein